VVEESDLGHVRVQTLRQKMAGEIVRVRDQRQLNVQQGNVQRQVSVKCIFVICDNRA
jgi:hypothetical protein